MGIGRKTNSMGTDACSTRTEMCTKGFEKTECRVEKASMSQQTVPSTAEAGAITSKKGMEWKSLQKVRSTKDSLCEG